ncbi:hypothetical protein KY290_005538 [Solanum tuberosum]|uniref:DUF4283 domain-containing protein n=1 Tax=Solanum tuberosum TaxID=4113 RepID=A0ABQ7WEF7_SOLTU|nr:hypothetical protein KY289_005926 [Solanum tuberosum]KAH0752318.1 hypothetical protein KY285_005466 [Solanum tuberosum]KAH0779111.1 hypothetical protein KY290_005538 [Solanum tuberosum]
MFKKNRNAGNGMALEYITPQFVEGEIVVQLEKEEVERETEKWNSALIVYAIGEFPGYFIVKFQSLEDTEEILMVGPYSINYRPLILKKWSADFDFSKEFPTDIPLWVKLPHLPLNCWGSNSLSRITSTIGTPMYADECTAKQSRVSFARMLIEVNITKPLLDKIVVKDPNGRVFTQQVIYEWKPMFCEVCQVIGHKCDPNHPGEHGQARRRRGHAGQKNVVQKWISKGPIIPATQTTQQQGE